MKRRVLLAGAGQLGSRYLQGMAKVAEPLAIWTYDPSAESLERARQRWAEVSPGRASHEVHYLQSMHELPRAFDLAIVATTANVRPALVATIAERARVENWVLEKILAQDLAGLETLQAAIGTARAWVNTPMHMWSLYRRVRAEFGDGPIRASFEGFRGLACNAIHYVDLVNRWNGSPVTAVDISGLASDWVPAKRRGFHEVEGTLRFDFADGSQLCLTSGGGGDEYRVHIAGEGKAWQVFEVQGFATSADGGRVEGSIEFQSALTAPMMAAIFSTGDCALPTLAQSVPQHVDFLSAMLAHWNVHAGADTVLPVT